MSRTVKCPQRPAILITPAPPPAIHITLVFAATFHWPLYFFDVKNAFLNGEELEREVSGLRARLTMKEVGLVGRGWRLSSPDARSHTKHSAPTHPHATPRWRTTDSGGQQGTTA